MDDRRTTEPRLLTRLAFAATAAIAICATGAVILLAPAEATNGNSTVSAAPAAATAATGYFPNQYVNQAKELEPVRDQF